jgi:hypothetical protein
MLLLERFSSRLRDVKGSRKLWHEGRQDRMRVSNFFQPPRVVSVNVFACGAAMPRRSRLTLAEVPQHLIQRGNNREATFYEQDDYVAYLTWLFQAAKKYGCRIYAHVLMTNHVHLLVAMGDCRGRTPRSPHKSCGIGCYRRNPLQRDELSWRAVVEEVTQHHACEIDH